MKTVIIGPGAMGCLFGALLAESEKDVRLLGRRKDHAWIINDNGVQVEKEGVVREVRVPVSAHPEAMGKADLVIIFVKSYDTAEASDIAARIVGPEGLVLTLQNGLGNADIIARYVGPERVLAGTTAQGSTLLGPGQIRHAGAGQTLLGMWGGGDPARAQAVADHISDCGITTETVDDIERVIWKKLIVNVGINAVTALTGVRNGQLLDLETTRKMCEAAVHEAAVVAKALGVDIGANPAKQVFQVARTTAPNRSSMGQDVDNKRRTEIEAINGAVVLEAEKLGIQVPVNQTLTALIKTLEAHY